MMQKETAAGAEKSTTPGPAKLKEGNTP